MEKKSNMLYVIIVLVSMFLIGLVNSLCLVAPVWQVALAVVYNTVLAIAISGLASTIVRRCLPNKWFTQDVKFFWVNKKECKFYEKLGIKKWKDKALELGMFTSFRKNKIAEPNNPEYISRYIMEANYGIVCHVASSILSFLLILMNNSVFYLTVAIPVAVVSFVVNNMSTMILRYNLPKLHVIYKYNLKHAKKEEEVSKAEEPSEAV